MEPHQEGHSASNAKPEGYQPPAVEQVMDGNELAREVHYAGGVDIQISPVAGT